MSDKPPTERHSVPFVDKRSFTAPLSAMSVAHISLMVCTCIEDCIRPASAAAAGMISESERSESGISRSVTCKMYECTATPSEAQSSCVLQLDGTELYRDGFTNTVPGGFGVYSVFCPVTDPFLEFSLPRGKDLVGPSPKYGF